MPIKNSLAAVFTILMSVVLAGAADNAASNAPSFRVIDGKSITVDLKAISQDKGDFGIDYKLHLDKKFYTFDSGASTNNSLSRDLVLNLKSEGFITVASKENKLNSIVSEFNLAGQPLYYSKSSGGGPRNWGEENETSDEAAIDLSRKQGFAYNSPLWLFLDVYVKNETTQDFKDYDLAFGSSLSLTTSYLNKPLDSVFQQLRWGDAAKNNNPRQLDLTFGYDRVIKLDQTANQALWAGQDEVNRLLAKVEWETGIFQAQRLVLSYNMHYALDAPSAIRAAGKDFNQFFMVRVDLLRWETPKGNYSVSVKYTNGELPPNFTKGQVLGGGFSIEF